MQTVLTYGFYIAIAAVFIILIFGIVNLARQDEDQASRSNKLMRMRVIVQFIAVMILVAIGFVSGAIKF